MKPKDIIRECVDLQEFGELTKEKLLDFQAEIIKTGSPNGILRFAEKIKTADIQLLENALITIPNSKGERLAFAFLIPKASISKLLDDLNTQDIEDNKEIIKEISERHKFNYDEFLKFLKDKI